MHSRSWKLFTISAGILFVGGGVCTVPVAAAQGQLPSGEESTAKLLRSIAPPSSAAAPAIPEVQIDSPGIIPSRSLRTRGIRISSGFGLRTDPLTGGERRHAGVDLPGVTGSPIHATGNGRVVRAGWAGGYGLMVEVAHAGGIRTRYGHLSRIYVAKGDEVSAGETIAAMGSTGRSTGTHVHYEVIVANHPVDPLRFAARRM